MSIKAEISRLTVGPGDVLAIRCERPLTPEEARVLAERAQNALKHYGMHSVPVLVTGPDIRIEIEARGEETT